MRRQHLILNQCIQQSELNWSDLHHEWQLFPHSLEFLTQLLQTYYQPFKLIMCISARNLHNLLRNSKDSFGSLTLRFEEELLQQLEVRFLHTSNSTFVITKLFKMTHFLLLLIALCFSRRSWSNMFSTQMVIGCIQHYFKWHIVYYCAGCGQSHSFSYSSWPSFWKNSEREPSSHLGT